jgi:hypothetical protein
MSDRLWLIECDDFSLRVRQVASREEAERLCADKGMLTVACSPASAVVNAFTYYSYSDVRRAP